MKLPQMAFRQGTQEIISGTGDVLIRLLTEILEVVFRVVPVIPEGLL
jgi:hypothetical protein